MSSRLIYICAVILLVGIQEIRAQQRDTIVIHDTVYMAVCSAKSISWHI